MGSMITAGLIPELFSTHELQAHQHGVLLGGRATQSEFHTGIIITIYKLYPFLGLSKGICHLTPWLTHGTQAEAKGYGMTQMMPN